VTLQTVDELTRYLMIAEARKKHGDGITPCTSKSSLHDCFTVENGRVIFWYNTPDGSTHTIIKRHGSM
jgi:hypothetical protein